MRIDIHCHILGNGKDLKKVDEDVYFNADDNNHWFTRILYNMVEGDLKRMGADFNRDGTISTDEYFELIYTMLAQSEEIDGIVLLALDAVFSPKTGELDEQKTDLWVSNVFLNRKIQELNERLHNESDRCGPHQIDTLRTTHISDGRQAQRLLPRPRIPSYAPALSRGA